MTLQEETTIICYLQVFLFAPVEFQSSSQDLNFVGVLLSCRNLALITCDPFQLLKGLFFEEHLKIASESFSLLF